MACGLLILYQHNNDLSTLYANGTYSKLYDQNITTTNTTTYSFYPTHKGYLSVLFSTGDQSVELYARIRKGQIGDYFQGSVYAYAGNEPFLMIPCVENEEYILLLRRANTNGSLNIKVFLIY